MSCTSGSGAHGVLEVFLQPGRATFHSYGTYGQVTLEVLLQQCLALVVAVLDNERWSY